jgi:hypothetical protein
MSTPFDALEQQLNSLRPARLPAPTRRHILRRMELPAVGHQSMHGLFRHRVGFQIALAGAFSLALVVGWHWLPGTERPASNGNQMTLVAGSGLFPSLVFWETKLAATSPIGANNVVVLRSPSMLTNLQIRR